MRSLLVAAALLAVGTAVPTLAAPAVSMTSPPTTALTSVQRLDASPTVQATKKKKKKKKSLESASITEIGNAKRAKTDLEIRATVAKAGRTCELSVKWKDGSTSEDESESKEDKVCEFSIEVPNSTKVVGEATANLTVKDSAGKKVATTSKKFTVK